MILKCAGHRICLSSQFRDPVYQNKLFSRSGLVIGFVRYKQGVISMKLSILVFLLSIMGAQARAAGCEALASPEFGEAARSYMRENGLIGEGSEADLPDIKVFIRWHLHKVVGHKAGCLVVMTLVANTDLQNPEAHSAYEVVGYDRKSKRFLPFESMVKVPKKIVARIGDRPDLDRKFGYYYVELSGPSVADALKSVVTNTLYSGFSGVAVLGEKAAFDPTPKRNWKIVDGTYSLRRGMTGEGMDIQSFQLDGSVGGPAQAYWQGCFQPPPPRNKLGFCSVAPWNQAFINGIEDMAR